MLGDLQEKLRNVVSKIKGTSHFDDEVLDDVLEDLQKALIKSDVDPQLVFSFTDHVRERVKEEKGLKFTKREQFLYVVYDELTKIIGEGARLEVSEKPYKVLLVGLFGSGKTTTCAKLARYYKKRGYKIALLGLDTYRPAAMEQIKQLSEEVKVPYFIKEDAEDPVEVINEYEGEFEDYDLIIADSAGRDALNEELAQEIKSIKKGLDPHESILTIPADIGQSAKEQARRFQELVNVEKVILTKMDGTAKGGGALTACYETNSPILFLGTGEKLRALEEFEPKGFVSRLLGLGDLKALLRRAEEAFTVEEAQEASEKFLKGEFNLIDFYKQIKGIKDMGSLGKLMNMMPGAGGLPKNLIDLQEDKMQKFEYVMQSMTFEELKNPKLVKGTRLQRVAFGAGVSESEVKQLIKSYKQLKKLSKRFNPRKMKNMRKNFNLKDLQRMI